MPTVRYRVLIVVLRIAVCWFFQNDEMRSQESNYMYSSFTKSTIKKQNTQLTEKSVGITNRIFPDYPIEKSQYPINKKISGYYPIHQNFLSGALTCEFDKNRCTRKQTFRPFFHFRFFLYTNFYRSAKILGQRLPPLFRRPCNFRQFCKVCHVDVMWTIHANR